MHFNTILSKSNTDQVLNSRHLKCKPICLDFLVRNIILLTFTSIELMRCLDKQLYNEKSKRREKMPLEPHVVLQ